MFNSVPRVCFGLPIVVLGVAAGLVGCGGSDSHHGHGYTDKSLNLGTLSSKQTATIALGYYPGSDASDSAVINLSCKGVARPASVKVYKALDTENESIERYGTPEMEAAGRAAVEKYKKQCLAKGTDIAPCKANTVYTDLNEGETTLIDVYLRSEKNVTVQKMHKNSDTSSVIVLAEVVNGEPVISKEKALSYDEYFGTNNHYDPEGLGIGERVRKTFGSEWRKDGGMDGTKKVVLIFLSSNTIGSGTYGYCTTIDSLPKSQESYSNEGEILYLNGDKEGIDIYSTIAHEFQHMCNFNQKYIKDGTFSGDSFEMLSINEGQSMLAEDICGFNLDPVCDGEAEPGNYFLGSAINSYLSNPNEVNSVSFDNTGGAYGKAYLTMRYIADAFGVDYVTRIATSSSVGFDNVVNVTKSTLPNLMAGMTVACTALDGLPSSMKYTNLELLKEYELCVSEDTSETVLITSIYGDEVEASDFGSGSIELDPNTSAVIDILGDGSQVKLNYSMPENCAGTVVTSENNKCMKTYTMK
ncbi:hypothetical protein IJT17_05455 [bacterium]|nr:hypothetical protein [bacterium]